MRTIIFILFLFPLFTSAQTTNVYLKLTDAAGLQIKGDAITKGYERSIAVQSFSTAGKNNSQLSFSMGITGASADLKRAMGNGSLLANGILTVTQTSTYAPIILYTIKMENIRVNSCAESLGCNGAMTNSTILTADRIGWTYYQTDASGKTTVSRKYGFDNDSGKEWTNF